MNKYWGILIGMMMVMVPVYLAAQSKPYVRKQLEPDFFIPESAKPQPEKLPMPRYLKGQAKTVKEAKRMPSVKTQPEAVAETEEAAVNEETIPEFQKKYDDYNRDINHITRTGQIPENQKLDEDLKAMNSNQPQVIEKKPYQPRNTKAKFDKALEQSLQSN